MGVKNNLYMSDMGVMKKHITTSILAFFVLCLAYQGYVYYQVELSEVPRCDQEEVKNLAVQIVEDQLIKGNREIASLYGADGFTVVGLNNVAEVTYNDSKEIRGCSAQLISNRGQDAVFYSIQWNNNKKDEYLVEINFQ